MKRFEEQSRTAMHQTQQMGQLIEGFTSAHELADDFLRKEFGQFVFDTCFPNVSEVPYVPTCAFLGIGGYKLFKDINEKFGSDSNINQDNNNNNNNKNKNNNNNNNNNNGEGGY